MAPPRLRIATCMAIVLFSIPSIFIRLIIEKNNKQPHFGKLDYTAQSDA